MTNAPAFIQMAERVTSIPDECFAGAFLIVLPDGKTRSTVLVDEHKDPAILLHVLKTHVDSIISELEQANNVGRRR